MCTIDFIEKTPLLCEATLRNGLYALHVFKIGEFLIAMSLLYKVGDMLFVPIAKVAEPGTYDDFYRLLSKLATKDVSSKYFAKPVFEEHLVNGNVPADKLPELEKLVMWLSDGTE